jgi:hypothetical protein
MFVVEWECSLLVLLESLSRYDVSASAPSAPIIVAPFLHCLNYMRIDVLSSYYSWKYARVAERWEMGIQILSILHEVLTVRRGHDMAALLPDAERENHAQDVRPQRDNTTLRDSVTQSLATDSAFHHVLLSVVGIGHEILLKVERESSRSPMLVPLLPLLNNTPRKPRWVSFPIARRWSSLSFAA